MRAAIKGALTEHILVLVLVSVLVWFTVADPRYDLSRIERATDDSPEAPEIAAAQELQPRASMRESALMPDKGAADLRGLKSPAEEIEWPEIIDC